MKVWIEYPEATRFAKATSDILYTPIFFANEGITGHLKFDKDWTVFPPASLDARVRLIGKASLGYLSVGGRPSNGVDTRYAMAGVGFRPIYTLNLLELVKRVRVDEDLRTHFTFTLPCSTLEDLQQLSSSLKVISAESVTNVNVFASVAPALIIYVRYFLVADVYVDNKLEGECEQEIRVFASLARHQVPTAIPTNIANPGVIDEVKTHVFPVGRSRPPRRQSIPFVRRLSRAQSMSSGSSTPEDEQFIVVDVEPPEPFTFRRHDDAAATKMTVTLTCQGACVAPGVFKGDMQWMLKSTTSLAFEPVQRENQEALHDDYFHLRAKILPLHKAKLKWSSWEPIQDPIASATYPPPVPTDDSPEQPTVMSRANTQPAISDRDERSSDVQRAPTKWRSTAHVWFTHPLKAALTPTFATPYLSHLYTLSIDLAIAAADNKFAKVGLTPRTRLGFSVPVAVRYDLGLAPSYEVDHTLPEYDHTLPHYDDSVRRGESGQDLEGETADLYHSGTHHAPGDHPATDDETIEDDNRLQDVLQVLMRRDMRLNIRESGSEQPATEHPPRARRSSQVLLPHHESPSTGP